LYGFWWIIDNNNNALCTLVGNFKCTFTKKVTVKKGKDIARETNEACAWLSSYSPARLLRAKQNKTKRMKEINN